MAFGIKMKIIGLLVGSLFLTNCTSTNLQKLNGETLMKWIDTEATIVAVAKDKCIDENENIIFGPKPISTGNESLTGILATAGANLIVDGASAILKSAGEARNETSPVETSFKLSVDKGPKCFEIQKRRDGRLVFAAELGLEQGGKANNDKYFRLVPTRLKYGGPNNKFPHFLDGSTRSLSLNVVISQIDGTSPSSFTINLGEWGISNGDKVFKQREISGPWFVLKGSGKGEVGYNIAFTLIEAKSSNELAKLMGNEFEARKTDLRGQLKERLTPAAAPTIDELSQSNNDLKALISTFCSEQRPLLEKANGGDPMSGTQITNYNVSLDLLREQLKGSPYEAVINTISTLSYEAAGNSQINNPNFAKEYLKTFNELCG